MASYEHGNLAITGGPIFTSDPNRPKATAVGIRNGIVTYVGDDAGEARQAAGPGAEQIDLAGRLATPGLIDAHCHPIYYGGQLANLDLQTGISRIQDILDRVQRRAEEVPAGDWITGWGYYVMMIAEGRPPTRYELDAVAPDHPVYLRQRSGHEAVTNSLGLNMAGITRDTPDPEGGTIVRDADGEPTGLLIENAQDPLSDAASPEVTPASIEHDLRRATDSFLSFGITSVGEANITSPEMFRAYQRLRADADTPAPRYNLMLSHWKMLQPAEEFGLMTGFGDRWLRVGTMKFFLDGTEGQRTAKVSESFADDPDNTGMWMFPPEEFRERVFRAHLAGWQCATHAIGDAAVEETLDAYAAVQAALPRPDIRHRVEHASLLRPDLIQRLMAEQVIPVPGARFASNDYPVLLAAFGKDRLRWYQPWNSLVERGIPVPVSSDAPVQSPNPIPNLKAIATSRSELDDDLMMQAEERLPLDEVLIAYTRNGAFASHEEHVKGMLREGMLGDLTVFDRDLFALEADDLDQAAVDLTIIDGVVVHRRDS
ncbi:amidohydrolase [soil metagenome]